MACPVSTTGRKGTREERKGTREEGNKGGREQGRKGTREEERTKAHRSMGHHRQRINCDAGGESMSNRIAPDSCVREI